MSRLSRLSGILPVLILIGCAEQPKPAPPPDPPILGVPSQTDGSPADTKKTADNETMPGDTDTTQPSAVESDSPGSSKTSDTSPSGGTPKKPTAPAGPTQVQFNLNHVTADYIAALVVHPRRALESPILTGLKDEGAFTDEDLEKAVEPFILQTGLNPREVEEIAVLIGKNVVNAAASEMGLPVEGGDPAAAAEKGPRQFKNNLKQVGLAFHNYHDVFGFLSAAGGSGDGENRNGFSWRAQLSPFVDAAPVYNLIQFDQDWDSDDNAALHEQMPESYQSAGVTDAGKTAIHVITGEGTLFDGDSGTPFAEVTDGLSNTLLAVSAGADTAEIWMKPGGLVFDPADPTKCLGEIDGEAFLVLLGDGSVRSLSKEIEPTVFANLVTSQDGNPVDLAPSDEPMEAPAPFGLTDVTPDKAPVILLKMAGAVDHDLLLSQLPGTMETRKQGDQEYFAADGWAMAFPTEQTAVFGGEAAVQELLAASETESDSTLAIQLRSASQPFDLLLTVDLTSQKELIQSMAQLNPMLGPIANVQSLSLAASSSGNPGELLLALHGLTVSPESAQTLAAMVNGLALNQLKMSLAMQSDDPDMTDGQREFLGIFQPVLESLEMTSEENRLALQVSIPEGFDKLPQILAPEIKKAREAAVRMQKMNSLRQIGLAFHNYHDTYTKFPKAGGPAEESDDIKDGLSWRVHLLPFLDEYALYQEFKLDEPWDSEHNMALVEKMPDIFKTDGVDEAGNTSIHVFIGVDAPFSDNAAPGIRDFTDGTSNTLLCVVAGADQAAIWTKPGGLTADPDDPFAALGEIGETFQALFGDGSVRFLKKTISPETLLHLIQHQDGNVIEAADLEN